MMKSNFFRPLRAKERDIRAVVRFKASSTGWKIFRLFLLLSLCYVVFFPIMFMLSNALRSGLDAVDPTIIWIPKHYTMQNFITVFALLDYPRSFVSTVTISIGSALLQIAVSAMTGYGFAKYKFRFRGVLFALVLFTVVIPQQILVMSLYLKFKFFDMAGFGYLYSLITGQMPNLLDNPLVFFVPSMFGVGLKGGLFIYIFRQFFRGLPNELMSAAKIDGCGHFGIFIKIMLPNAVPAIVSVFLFSVVWHWSEIFYSSVFLSTNQMLSPQLSSLRVQVFRAMTSNTASLMSLFTSESGSIESVIQAGVFLVILPVLLLYLVTQKFFVQGVERTGLVE